MKRTAHHPKRIIKEFRERRRALVVGRMVGEAYRAGGSEQTPRHWRTQCGGTKVKELDREEQATQEANR